jgi:uncharacterized phiE125 gp8 family phage protein
MPVEPVTAIVEFTYLDSAGAEQTLDPADYQAWLDHSPPLLAPDVLTAWPALQAGALKPITIDFTAGYGTAQAVPELVKAEILKTLADWDENRGRAGMELPESAKAGLMLLWTGGYR